MQPLDYISFLISLVLSRKEIKVNLSYSTYLLLNHSFAVGSSVSGLSGLYTVVMKAAGASRRVFQLLDRVSSMPKSGNQCPLG